MSDSVLNIFISSGCIQEMSWIADVLFQEFLGIPYSLHAHENIANTHILIKHEGHVLSLPDIFISNSKKNERSVNNLPQLPLAQWDISELGADLVDTAIPVLFGQAGFRMDELGNGHLNLDVFGSAFFMLSRYEELVVPERDNYDRFPATASIAYQADFLYRPIVDEYVEILWTVMLAVWSSLKRKKRQGQVVISCDVDEPYERWIKSPIMLAKGLAGSLIRRRSIKSAINRFRNAIASRKGNYHFDPNWNFEWYMDTCEQFGHKAAFYFIATPGKTALDCAYSLDEPRMQALLRQIHQRGHEIGMHGSYNTYRNGDRILQERHLLQQACERAGINTLIRGNRQHFLRWDIEETPDYLDAAVFEYDTTGSFADSAGFRYGTSKEFSMWSWQKHSALNIKQRPLIVMECSIISYLGLGYTSETLELMLELKQRSLKYGGDFRLLWHNSHFSLPQDKDFFVALIQ